MCGPMQRRKEKPHRGDAGEYAQETQDLSGMTWRLLFHILNRFINIIVSCSQAQRGEVSS